LDEDGPTLWATNGLRCIYQLYVTNLSISKKNVTNLSTLLSQKEKNLALKHMKSYTNCAIFFLVSEIYAIVDVFV
jgi:hypothetical protein